MEKNKLFATNANLFMVDCNSQCEINSTTKGLMIYKTLKNYKIVTLYKRQSGSYIISYPVTILPKDIDIDTLCESITESLRKSRSISEKEEELFDINLLKELKEKSYDNLYKNSKSCIVYITNQEISIEPNIYRVPRNGLITDKEKVVKLSPFESNLIDVSQILIDILS